MMTSFEELVGALFKDIQPFSNFDIIRICRKLKISNFKGCFMRDEIKSFCGNDECFILNTDVSSSSGSHWVAMNIADSSGTSDGGGTTYYFNSFGLEPIEEIKDIVRNLDFTIHLNFRNQTKLYVDICVYIFFTECVIVNKISIQSWMSYIINKIEYYYII